MLVSTPTSINKNKNGKEALDNLLMELDFSVNKGDILQYVTKKIEPHWHNEFEIFVLDEGTTNIEINGVHYTLKSGEGCFINSGVLHTFSTNEANSCKFRSFVFHPSIIAGKPGSIYDTHHVRPIIKKGIPLVVFTPNEHPQFFNCFNSAFLACEQHSNGYEFVLRFMLSNILLLCKDMGDLDTYSFQNDHIKHMMQWIEEHLEYNMTVKDIADSANICVRECQRIFNQYLHYTPMKYVRKRRILEASQLLVTTNMTITEITNMYLFSSSSHFSKVFKDYVGITPLQYRKKHLDKE